MGTWEDLTKVNSGNSDVTLVVDPGLANPFPPQAQKPTETWMSAAVDSAACVPNSTASHILYA